MALFCLEHIYFQGTTIFDLNMLNSIRLMVLIRVNLLNWTNNIKCCYGIEETDREPYLSAMMRAYIDLLNSYHLYIKVFQDTVSFIYFL